MGLLDFICSACGNSKRRRQAVADQHAKTRRELVTAIKVARRSRLQRLASGNQVEEIVRGTYREGEHKP